MIKELSELGSKIIGHHIALKKEVFSMDIVIDIDGSFEKFETFEERITIAERVSAKKGKARLLLDKFEEVLGFSDMDKNAGKKHKIYVAKLNEFKNVKELKPVLLFYDENNKNGIEKALSSFESNVEKERRKGNVAFRLKNDDHRIHEKKEVIEAIINKFESNQKSKLSQSVKVCSICGRNDYPAEDEPHGMIKRVPEGQTSGCALVSYNENAFESYHLKGNENSSICTNCATNYVEGLNWLLSNGTSIMVEDKQGKQKEVFKYSNRKNFPYKNPDTAMVYWTRQNQQLKELDILEHPTEGNVTTLIESVTTGDNRPSNDIEIDYFYSCSLSGAAARIAVRDWIETSLPEFRQSIVQWFKDIPIEFYNYKLEKCQIYYSRLYDLAKSCQSDKEKKEVTLSRIAKHLWNVALKNTSPPLWMLNAVLKRARLVNINENKRKYDGITRERASLIRLLLNRNNKGGCMIKEKLDPENKGTAYNAGRVFAVLESIQYAALGKTNAGIRERFFTAASTTPASAFGRIFKNSQNHLSKLKGEKPGLAVVLDKELTGLIAGINTLPSTFTLEEQGQFAIGYYHQKNHQFNKPELKEIAESEEI